MTKQLIIALACLLLVAAV